MVVNNKNFKLLGVSFGIESALKDNVRFQGSLKNIRGEHDYQMMDFQGEVISFHRSHTGYSIYFTVVDYKAGYVDGYIARADEVAPLLAFMCHVKMIDVVVDAGYLSEIVGDLEEHGYDVDMDLLIEML